jgi:hypothetical protein
MITTNQSIVPKVSKFYTSIKIMKIWSRPLYIKNLKHIVENYQLLKLIQEFTLMENFITNQNLEYT